MAVHGTRAQPGAVRSPSGVLPPILNGFRSQVLGETDDAVPKKRCLIVRTRLPEHRGAGARPVRIYGRAGGAAAGRRRASGAASRAHFRSHTAQSLEKRI